MNRNLTIDWVKGLMITIIVLHHFFLIPGFNQTYLPVDLFFCISGYFLMKNFINKKVTPLLYTVQRIKRIYPAFFISLLLSCLLLHSRLDVSNFSSFIATIGKLSLLMTLTNGLVTQFSFPIMDISWFLSILIIAGFILYSLLDYNKKLALSLLLPSSIIIGYTLIFSHHSSIQEPGTVYGLNINLIRGFCDMAIGVLVFHFYSFYREVLNRQVAPINIISLAALLFFISIMFSKECLDIYIVVTLPLVLLGLVYEKSWSTHILRPIKGGLFSLVGRYTLEILLIHQLVMIGFYKVLDIANITTPLFIIIILDLALVFIVAYFLHKFCDYISHIILK